MSFFSRMLDEYTEEFSVAGARFSGVVVFLAASTFAWFSMQILMAAYEIGEVAVSGIVFLLAAVGFYVIAYRLMFGVRRSDRGLLPPRLLVVLSFLLFAFFVIGSFTGLTNWVDMIPVGVMALLMVLGSVRLVMMRESADVDAGDEVEANAGGAK